jgi:hypothetical protein
MPPVFGHKKRPKREILLSPFATFCPVLFLGYAYPSIVIVSALKYILNPQ